MIRKLVLAVAILALAAAPVPALAGGHRHGGPSVSVELFATPYTPYYYAPYPYYDYGYPPGYVYVAPACHWQPGYWVNQPYVDAWGRYTYVQQWVPAQYVCY